MGGKKTLVIAGATGFIGRNLVNHFAANDAYRIRAVWHLRPPVDPPSGPVEWVQGDLTRELDVRRVLDGADVVIQAAATTSGAGDIVNRPHIHTTDNAVMNSLILRATHDLNIAQFLFFSCSIMYQPAEKPVRECDFQPGAPMHPKYFAAGWTKVYIEKMCEFYAGLGRTRISVLRHSNIFGPHDKFDLERSHMFGAMVTKIMTARDGDAIAIWGNGEEARDLIHVDDLVRCVELCIVRQEQPFGLFNVGSGKAVSVNEIAERVISASGKKLSVEHDLSKPTIPVTLSLDCGLIADAVGWSPRVSLDRGIEGTLRWWAENRPV
jgi:GDP-L-fucose synthase